MLTQSGRNLAIRILILWKRWKKLLRQKVGVSYNMVIARIMEKVEEIAKAKGRC